MFFVRGSKVIDGDTDLEFTQSNLDPERLCAALNALMPAEMALPTPAQQDPDPPNTPE
jgi:hypothetical protein